MTAYFSNELKYTNLKVLHKIGNGFEVIVSNFVQDNQNSFGKIAFFVKAVSQYFFIYFYI